MKPREEDLVRVEREEELHGGLGVWVDGPRGLKATVLLRQFPLTFCSCCDRAACTSWRIPAPLALGNSASLCACSAIEAGDLYRLRDLDAHDEQATERKRERVE